jgi:hypothetical protein
VMTRVADPAGQHFVENLARPGGKRASEPPFVGDVNRCSRRIRPPTPYCG